MARDTGDDGARAPTRVAHVLGEPLDDVSVGELDERLRLLRVEIERLEAAKLARRAASERAGSIFKS